MGQRSVPAPFLTKTYQLVGDTGSDDVISWGENGDSFVVWKMADFAKDLLPKYFKHNNFSSFVRQLNTYGFRKVVPDKWEFANDNFKKGQPELLSKIRRRKAVVVQTKQQQQQKGVASNPAATTTAVNNGSLTVTVNNPCADQTSLSAGDEMGSTSTSSASKGAPGSLDSNGSNQLTRIGSLDSNEKLRRDNENLRTELERSKKQCDGLVEFLTKQLKVGPNQINRIMYGSSRSNDGGSCSEEEMTCLDDSGIQDKKNVVEDDDENERSDDDEMEECVGDDDDDRSRHNLKLFGVLLKGCKGAAHDGGRNKKKRARVENMTTSAVTEGGAAAAAAAADHHHHQQLCWMRRIVSAAPGETSKVGFRRL